MKTAGITAVIALSAVCACTSAFALPPAGPSQQSTAHQDTEFLKKANQGSVDEVDLAKIVVDKTQDPDIKAFAQKMIDDHSKLLEDMKPFDREAGLDVPEHPDVPTVAMEAKLKLLSGKAFDKAYIKGMVEDHHKDLMEFSKEEKTTGYPEFKAAVAKGESVVKEHLKMIDDLAKKNGLPTEPVSGN